MLAIHREQLNSSLLMLLDLFMIKLKLSLDLDLSSILLINILLYSSLSSVSILTQSLLNSQLKTSLSFLIWFQLLEEESFISSETLSMASFNFYVEELNLQSIQREWQLWSDMSLEEPHFRISDIGSKWWRPVSSRCMTLDQKRKILRCMDRNIPHSMILKRWLKIFDRFQLC